MAYDDYQRIRIAVADGICRATVDNPPINLLDVNLIPELARFAQQVGVDDAVRVVVVDSADPDFFMAHADITLIQRLPTTTPRCTTRFPRSMRSGRPSAPCQRRRSPSSRASPAVAAANWPWPSTCASPRSARRGSPNRRSRSASSPAAAEPSGCPGWSDVPARLEVILGCDDIDAATAEAWGYVNRALPADELRPFVDELANRIASFPIEVIAAAKRAVDAAAGDPTPGLMIEDQLFRETLAGPAAADRMQAFMDNGGQTREFEIGALRL